MNKRQRKKLLKKQKSILIDNIIEELLTNVSSKRIRKAKNPFTLLALELEFTEIVSFCVDNTIWTIRKGSIKENNEQETEKES